MAITDGRIPWLSDGEQRLRITVTQTTHFKYGARYVSFLNNFLNGLQDVESAGGPPTGSGADPDDWFLVVPKIFPMGPSSFSYLIEDECSDRSSRFFQWFAFSSF